MQRNIRTKNLDDELDGAQLKELEQASPLVPRSPSKLGSAHGLTAEDKRAMVLLVALYLLQGIPVGLAFGSIPYLLRAKLSYSQIGIFTLCTYPYSLKLLWSPIVDSIFSPKIGRRKSWIVPIQTIVGIMLLWMSNNVADLVEQEIPAVTHLTVLFFILIFFAATQDIAVDGWALELLSQDNLSYASTAQTIGLNIGYFLSFTVFLAFNSIEFSNKYFRPSSAPGLLPLVTLSGYLKFSGVAYLVITAYLAFFQHEKPAASNDPDMDLKKVYNIMYSICSLKHVQHFIALHFVAKLGAAANDAVTSLKLLEKGLSKEDLALAVLIDFPFQIIFGYLAAKWSTGSKPLRPWVNAQWARIAFAAASTLMVYFFPKGPVTTPFFLLVITITVLNSFAGTVQFVGISAFHTTIADPLIGGTYMTLLNTISNLGGTWPRYFILRGVDSFSEATCRVKEAANDIYLHTAECVSDHGKAACSELGGECVTERDGYYIISTICVIIGALLLQFLIKPRSKELQRLPQSAWKVKLDKR